MRSLAACLCALVVAATTAISAPARVLAIGDIHGSLDGFVTILTRTGLVDANRRWTGGTATLVQTGDFTDRGPGVRPVMDLLMALEVEAKKAGGQVIVLLGNHEVMNLIGETRDVTGEIFATFADAKSEGRRENAWRQYEQLAKGRQSREAWMASHPPGYLEYREAFSQAGVYGRWLRSKSPATRVADTAFMHAGIDPSGDALTLERFNASVRSELARFDDYVRELVARKLALPFFSFQEVLEVTAAELRIAGERVAAAKQGRDAPSPTLDARWLKEALLIHGIGQGVLLAPNGPMWFRGYATWPDSAGPMLSTILDRLRVARIVVGHTPQVTGAIRSRFDNRLFLIDTGMLASVYKGRPSALEIDGAQIRALYPDQEVALVSK
jgi:hypothetical protein